VPPLSLAGKKGRNGGGGGKNKGGDASESGAAEEEQAGDAAVDTATTATTPSVEPPAAVASDDSAAAVETPATDEEGGGGKHGKRHGAACQLAAHALPRHGRCTLRPACCFPWQARVVVEVEVEVEVEAAEAEARRIAALRRMQWRRRRWATQLRNKAEGGVTRPFDFSVGFGTRLE